MYVSLQNDLGLSKNEGSLDNYLEAIEREAIIIAWEEISLN